MKRIFSILALFLCLSLPGLAQTTSQPRVNSVQFREQATVPFCPQDMTCIYANASGVLYSVLNGTSTAIGGGGGTGTVTSVSFTGGLISVATATTTPALTVAGTSGGVPYFSSSSTWASSGALTLNALTLGGGAGAAPKVAAGLTTDGTSVLTLGVAGTSVGGIGFKNATSGTITLQPVTGALGTVTLSLPATTGTLALTSALPAGANPTASVGLSAVNGVATTFLRSDGAPALDQSIAPTWTGAHTHTNTIALTSTTAANNKITQGAAINIGTTSTDGIILQNTTAAAVGAQQFSPRVRWTGSGWKTNATAGAQTVDFIAELQPVQNASAPFNNLIFSSQTNGGGYTSLISVGLNATLNTPGIGFGGPISASNATGILGVGTGNLTIQSGGTQVAGFLGASLALAVPSNLLIGWTSSTAVTTAPDTALRRLTAASIVQGNANNATPVANIFTIGESSRGGTDNNVAGANGTVQSGLGTGTGAITSLILRSPIAAASGTTAQTYATGLTIIGGTAKMTSYTVSALPAAATVGAGARAFVTDALTPVFGSAVTGGGAVGVPVFSDGSSWIVG